MELSEHEKTAFAAIADEHEKDVSTLEDATSRFDEASRGFTESLARHAEHPFDAELTKNIRLAHQAYSSGFGRLAETIDLDPIMDSHDKQQIIARTILGEEEKRLAYIEGLVGLRPCALPRTEPPAIYLQMLKIYVEPPTDNSVPKSLETLFDFMVRRDASAYMQNLLRG